MKLTTTILLILLSNTALSFEKLDYFYFINKNNNYLIYLGNDDSNKFKNFINQDVYILTDKSVIKAKTSKKIIYSKNKSSTKAYLSLTTKIDNPLVVIFNKELNITFNTKIEKEEIFIKEGMIEYGSKLLDASKSNLLSESVNNIRGVYINKILNTSYVFIKNTLYYHDTKSNVYSRIGYYALNNPVAIYKVNGHDIILDISNESILKLDNNSIFKIEMDTHPKMLRMILQRNTDKYREFYNSNTKLSLREYEYPYIFKRIINDEDQLINEYEDKKSN